MREVVQRPSPDPLGRLADAALVARCREGDEVAWKAFIERFSRYVYAIAVRGFQLSQSEAEEVFQEVFARAYEHLDRLRDDEAIRPWIAQLTRRLAIDQLRDSAQAEPTEDAGGQIPVDEDLFARLDEALSVHEALARLPQHCREILDRFFARDESYRAISAALEIPPGTIASRISRCLAKLRAELQGRSLGPRAS
jgi:RNA polymerase sigma-70 factor (ECF subfamily)